MLKLYPLPSASAAAPREAPTAVDLDELYQDPPRPAPEGRPWVALNMVVSVDGATALDGRSGGLGGPADRAAFFALRAAADVIVAGAGTVRAENYGPPRTNPTDQERRRQRGQPPFPRIAIVSGSLHFDLQKPIFTDTPTRPLVLTHTATDPGLRAAVEKVADVIVAGDDHVDLSGAFRQLGSLGLRFALVEGGPKLNGALAADDLLDEVNLTVGPVLAGGTSRSLLGGATLPTTLPLTLAHAVEDDGLLLLRYQRR